MRNIREFSLSDLRAGVACPQCKLLFFDRVVLDLVRLADAELLFCPSCKANVGVVLDTTAAEALPRAASA